MANSKFYNEANTGPLTLNTLSTNPYFDTSLLSVNSTIRCTDWSSPTYTTTGIVYNPNMDMYTDWQDYYKHIYSDNKTTPFAPPSSSGIVIQTNDAEGRLQKIVDVLGMKESKSPALGMRANGKTYDILDILDELVEKAFGEKKEEAVVAPIPAKPKLNKVPKFFWVLEKSDSPVSSPLYFGGIVNGIVNWTDDYKVALQFSKKDDAEFYQKECIIKGWDMFREVRIAEHGEMDA